MKLIDTNVFVFPARFNNEKDLIAACICFKRFHRDTWEATLQARKEHFESGVNDADKCSYCHVLLTDCRCDDYYENRLANEQESI